MLKLMENELKKLFVRRKVYVFLIILALITCFAGFGMNYMIERQGAANVGLGNMNGQAFPLAMLDGLGDLIGIFVIILVADMITEEYLSGTLKLSLLRPVRRKQFLTAKLLALAVIIGLLLISTMVVSYIVGIFFFGWGDQLVLGTDTFTTTQGILAVVKGYLAGILPVLALGVVTMLVALYMNSVGSVIGIALGFFFASDIIGQLSADLRPFLLTTYFNYYRSVVTGNWQEVVTGLGVILLYGGSAYLLSLISFQQKDLLH